MILNNLFTNKYKGNAQMYELEITVSNISYAQEIKIAFW